MSDAEAHQADEPQSGLYETAKAVVGGDFRSYLVERYVDKEWSFARIARDLHSRNVILSVQVLSEWARKLDVRREKAS